MATDVVHGRDEATKGKRRLVACACGAAGVYDDRYDCFYCPHDGCWLEPECGCAVGTCEFVPRPARHT